MNNLKPKINNFLHKKWQQHWNRNTNNKLFQVKPFLGEWPPAFRKSRKRRSNNKAIIHKNSNPSARHAKHPAQSNTFFLSVKILITPGSTISTQTPSRTYLRTSTWMMFCRSWKRPGCTRKYRLGYNPKNTTN